MTTTKASFTFPKQYPLYLANRPVTSSEWLDVTDKYTLKTVTQVALADGDIIWNKNYGGTNSDIANAITENNIGGFIINGQSNSSDGDVVGLHGDFASDMWTMEINGDGDIIWKKCFGGTADETGTDVLVNNSGNYVLAGIAKIGEIDHPAPI